MSLVRFILGVTTLGFVLVTHLIGFNNVRVLGIFWIPEFVLILYVIFSLIPAEHIPGWYNKLKSMANNRNKKKKVVKFPAGKWKKLPVLTILDGMLITLIAALALFLLYKT